MSSKPFGTPAQDLLDDGQIEEPTIHYKIKKKRKTMKITLGFCQKLNYQQTNFLIM